MRTRLVRLTSQTELDIGEFGGYYDLEFGAQWRKIKQIRLDWESLLIKRFGSPTLHDTPSH